MNHFHNFIRPLVRPVKNVIFVNTTNIYRHYCAKTMEQSIKVSDATINYLKVGNGNKTILCFPGALGTIWSDFKPQINQLNKDNFTIVAFDPPGYGLSRPPNRVFNTQFYKNDAKYAFELMKTLGINKYSLLGWSDGGISSIILAAEYPDAIDKLIIWGANSHLLPEDIEAYENIRDTKKWSTKAKEPLIKLYGEDGLQNMWASWCDTLNEIKNKSQGNICMEYLSKIKCPTLILHGALDAMVHSEHPNYLNTHIKNSRLHIFPKGKHNIHLRYADEFNSIVTKFILEEGEGI